MDFVEICAVILYARLMICRQMMGNLFLLPFLTLMSQLATGDQAPPHIILINADDIGYGDFGCYGARLLDTPSVDALAARGIRFTSAYASSPTCTPSRYSLLTGEYAFRNRSAEILPGNAPLIIDPDRPTLASVLKRAGYRTGLVGKWHLGLGHSGVPLDWNGDIRPGPNQLGFDFAFYMASTGDRVPSVLIEDGRILGLEKDDPISVSYREKVGDWPTGTTHPELLKVQADADHSGTIVHGISRIGTMTGGKAALFKDEELGDIFLREAMAFIRKNHEKPFFLYYATHENHVPRWPHPRFQGSSSLGFRGDAVVQFDWGVGRIMDLLEELGIEQDTLIILTSDNGPVLFDGYWDGAISMNGEHRPAGPFRGGKYSRWEGGIRMPFIVSWPRKITPGISNALIGQVDMLASLACLANVPLTESEKGDSMNVLAALMGETADGRDYLVMDSWKQLTLRRGEWKYIAPGEIIERTGIGQRTITRVPERGFLFHLTEDPGETNDLAEAFPNKLLELQELVESVRRKKTAVD